MVTNRDLKLIKKLYESGDVIHVKTYRESLKLSKILHKAGYTWCNNRTYIDLDQWNFYKQNTVHYIADGTYGILENALENGYVVTEFSDIAFSNDFEIKYLI